MKRFLATGLVLLVAVAPAWASHRLLSRSRGPINCPPSATIWVNGVPYAPPPAPPGIEVKTPTGTAAAPVQNPPQASTPILVPSR